MPASRRPSAIPAALLAALAAALLLAAGPLLGRAALADATSWIDAPLDGSVLPLAPYEVVAHSADQAGIAEVLFDQDGANIDSAMQYADGSARLVTSRFQWVPPTYGTYVLTIRARNSLGELGAPASATVVISADAASPAPTADPGASPGESPGPSPSAGASLPPGQTATPAPTTPPGVTPAPTPTKAPTPAPTICPPPTPILDTPNDFVELDYPSEAQPLFEWHYSGGTGCLASQTIHIYNQVVGVDISADLGAGARSYQQRSNLPWDPDNTGDRSCAHYHWEVTGFNADGDGEQSASGSFRICELNPDA